MLPRLRLFERLRYAILLATVVYIPCWHWRMFCFPPRTGLALNSLFACLRWQNFWRLVIKIWCLVSCVTRPCLTCRVKNLRNVFLVERPLQEEGAERRGGAHFSQTASGNECCSLGMWIIIHVGVFLWVENSWRLCNGIHIVIFCRILVWDAPHQ